jgi:hypothetical protein
VLGEAETEEFRLRATVAHRAAYGLLDEAFDGSNSSAHVMHWIRAPRCLSDQFRAPGIAASFQLETGTSAPPLARRQG